MHKPKLVLSAMYGTNFNPKIFTEITMPAKQSYGSNIIKKSELLMVLVRSLHFTVIESVVTQSWSVNTKTFAIPFPNMLA